MASFFRRVRRQLFHKNRFTRYLVYAFGEILLVVIGILIALQVNNFNEQRRSDAKEKKYPSLTIFVVSVLTRRIATRISKAFS